MMEKDVVWVLVMFELFLNVLVIDLLLWWNIMIIIIIVKESI